MLFDTNSLAMHHFIFTLSTTQVLDNGNDLRVKNLGTFKQKATAARTGRNPKTGEELQIKAITTIAFSVASNLKVREGEETEEDE